MEAEFGLFKADQRRRLGIAEDGEQAEIAQGAVRETRGGDTEVSFGEEDLNRATLHGYVEVVNTVVKILQSVQYGSFGDRKSSSEPIQKQTKIREILLQDVIPHIRLLGLPENGVPTK